MASDPCLEERNAVEAQLAIVSTLMADLGMQIAELDARIQILENCEFENQNPMPGPSPMLSDETPEAAICRLTNHRQHLIGLCELLRKDVIAMQAKCEAMQKILKGQ